MGFLKIIDLYSIYSDLVYRYTPERERERERFFVSSSTASWQELGLAAYCCWFNFVEYYICIKHGTRSLLTVHGLSFTCHGVIPLHWWFAVFPRLCHRLNNVGIPGEKKMSSSDHMHALICMCLCCTFCLSPHHMQSCRNASRRNKQCNILRLHRTLIPDM
jgi:hypothetical protein